MKAFHSVRILCYWRFFVQIRKYVIWIAQNKLASWWLTLKLGYFWRNFWRKKIRDILVFPLLFFLFCWPLDYSFKTYSSQKRRNIWRGNDSTTRVSYQHTKICSLYTHFQFPACAALYQHLIEWTLFKIAVLQFHVIIVMVLILFLDN